MIKTLSAVAIVTAVLASPVFAQDEAAPHKPTHALRHYRGSYNQAPEPAIVTSFGLKSMMASSELYWRRFAALRYNEIV